MGLCLCNEFRLLNRKVGNLVRAASSGVVSIRAGERRPDLQEVLLVGVGKIAITNFIRRSEYPIAVVVKASRPKIRSFPIGEEVAFAGSAVPLPWDEVDDIARTRKSAWVSCDLVGGALFAVGVESLGFAPTSNWFGAFGYQLDQFLLSADRFELICVANKIADREHAISGFRTGTFNLDLPQVLGLGSDLGVVLRFQFRGPFLRGSKIPLTSAEQRSYTIVLSLCSSELLSFIGPKPLGFLDACRETFNLFPERSLGFGSLVRSGAQDGIELTGVRDASCFQLCCDRVSVGAA